MRTITLCALTLFLAAKTAPAATRNVFFAGGQSNAKQVWGDALAVGLQPAFGSNLVMTWTNHSGEGLANWFTAAPQKNYSNDLFNAAGTGLLQAQIRAITNAGDQAVFRGFFWFQGETDTGSYDAINAYTNRFKAMMVQLRQDLGVTNDLPFTLAIIDANPDPALDDDLAAIGRTREMVDDLRTNQITLCSGPQGASVDTRSYARNANDLWHLPTDELTRLGLAMSAAFTNKFGASLPPAETTDLFSEESDGAVYPTGTFPLQDLICGMSAGTPYNGIAFFRLPERKLASSSLSLTVVVNSGALPFGANIDVWGLGFQSAASLSKDWFTTNNADTRLLINGYAPAKLADNIITGGQSVAVGTVWRSDAAQSSALKEFLNGLYDKGAKPGDIAVIRVNPDNVLPASTTGVRWGGSHRTTPDQRAKLTVALSAESFAEEGVLVYSHANDGALNPGGVLTGQDLISGTGGGDNSDFNGIAFFMLPEQPLHSADLSLTAQSVSGVLSGANLDVWGLGYQSTPAMAREWFSTNNTDARLLLNGTAPTKLADNIVTSGQAVAVGSVWRPTNEQRSSLKRFINSLYSNGAAPGDYAAIRINVDASQAGVYRGVRWGGSHQTSPDRRATLSAVIPVVSNRATNMSFESGAGASPLNWTLTANGFAGHRTNASPRSGSASFRVSTSGDQSANTANNLNVYQDVDLPGVADRRVTFSFYARHNSSEPLFTNTAQRVEARIWWKEGGSLLTFVDGKEPLVPTDPKDYYKQVLVSAVAPTNATGARAMIIFRTGTVGNPAVTNGAAIIDDVRVTLFEPLIPEGTLLRVK